MARLYLALAAVIALATPARAADDVPRVRAHLTHVLAELRAADVHALSPAQREARRTALATLETYTRRGVFPRRTGDAYGALRPRFIDDRGVHCAVGELVSASGHESLARAINRDYEYAYVRDMRSPALAAWARDHGFTVAELARIQPGYSSPPNPEETRRMIEDGVDAFVLACAPDHPALSTVRLRAIGTEHGAISVVTGSDDPFARCVAQHAREAAHFGGAWRGSPEAFDLAIVLKLPSPQAVLDKHLREIRDFSSCLPRPGPVPRSAAIDIRTGAAGPSVLIATTPHNTEVEMCAEAALTTSLSVFKPGRWQLHASRTMTLVSPLDSSQFREAIKMHAQGPATDCYPAHDAPAKLRITVSAHVDDPDFTIEIGTRDATYAQCITDKLHTQFRDSYSVGRKRDDHFERYFRIDREVHETVEIPVETPAARAARIKELERELDRNRYRID